MSLRSCRVNASVAVTDMASSRAFYEDRLGLSAGPDQFDDSRIYLCGEGTALHVYPSPATAGTSAGTLATWYTDDLERLVDELSARGVAFERYDDPELTTDAKGIHDFPGGRVAWFRDPSGNTFAIEQ